MMKKANINKDIMSKIVHPLPQFAPHINTCGAAK
jgi:hypothetical protein